MERKMKELYFDSSYSYHIDTHYGISPYTSPHIHLEIEILYGMEGICEAIIDRQTYLFGKGDMIIANSLENHAVNTVSEGHHRYGVVKFGSELLFSVDHSEIAYHLSEKLRQSQNKRFFTAEELAQSPVPLIFSQLAQEETERFIGNEIAVKEQILALYLWLLRYYIVHVIPQKERLILNSSMQQQMKTVLDYIHHNYASEISAAAMAKLCHLSYPYFSKVFHLATGYCFCEYINRLRVDYAKGMLLQGNKTVTEIASVVGFDSSSYFIQQFRRFSDETPYQFQKRKQKNQR